MIIIFLFFGIILGTLAGLIPGLHSNNITKIAFLLPLFEIEGMVLILSMGIVQSFVDFIPSIFFGAPDTDTFEGVLPGHKMFLSGDAFHAINLTVFGGIIAGVSSLALLFIFIQFITISEEIFPILIPPILIFSIITLIISENTQKKKLIAGLIIFASATQGLLFAGQIFPLITGYFGLATIINSQKEKKIKQKTNNTNLKKTYIIDALTGILGGAIVAIIPGIGNNLAAAIIKLFREKIPSKNYLVLLGSINTSNFIFSFPMLFFLNKARNGTMLFLKEESIITPHAFNIGLIIILISIGIGAIITTIISKKISKININFNKIEKIIFILIIILVFLFNGIIGLIALFFSTALGLLTVKLKVKRSNCLGFLIIPVLFFYLFILI
jgi:putative membrane protein